MTTNKNIRRHANGSIDTAYYISRAHLIRSQAAHETIADLSHAAQNVPSPAEFLQRLFAFLGKEPKSVTDL